MDANKLVKLKVIGYQVRQTCRNCVHANFGFGALWGTCNLHTYQHQKHTDQVRQLSINVSGRCETWENPGFGPELEGFAELRE